jgi:cation:H+ antiporter
MVKVVTFFLIAMMILAIMGRLRLPKIGGKKRNKKIAVDMIFVASGLVLLLIAGDVLVRGAVALSLRLGIPALIVSLTIVAFGTSAPELLIAIQSALAGVPGLALGNVVGSNTANVLLVLGVPAIISGIPTGRSDCRFDYNLMIIASVVFIVLCWLGPLHIWHGMLLLAGIVVFLGNAFIKAHRSRRVQKALEEELGDDHMAWWKISTLMVIGLIGLPVGADMLVDGAVNIAQRLGMDEAIIGLTLVAVGTSLPELATTVMAALRKQAEVAIGNVIGSNIFNLLAIMGVASFFGPLPVPAEFFRIDLWVMLGTSLLLAPFALGYLNMGRAWGFAFLGGYTIYMVSLLQ